MSVVADDLLQPKGPLDYSLFPGEQSNVLKVRLGQYLTNGYDDERVAAQTSPVIQDNLARAYALYQAFRDIYIRLSASPVTLSEHEKGSHGYNVEQIRNFKALSDKYLADFNGLLYIDGAVVPSQLPASMSIRNTVEW